MATITTVHDLRKAQAVVNILETIMDKDAPDDQNIYVGSFSNGSVSGLSLNSPLLDRKCNIFGCPVTESVVAMIGNHTDFNYPEGTAKDSATRLDFGNNYYAAAECVMTWMTTGVVEYNDSLAR
jgi:sucrose-6-phosphate hydrolase SacC (GH32 family)